MDVSFIENVSENVSFIENQKFNLKFLSNANQSLLNKNYKQRIEDIKNSGGLSTLNRIRIKNVDKIVVGNLTINSLTPIFDELRKH